MKHRFVVIGLAVLAPLLAKAQAEEPTLVVTNNTAGTITTFKVKLDGTLVQAGIHPCGTNPYDAQITPDGKWLVACQTSAATSELVYVMRVNADSTLSPSGTPTPIGDGCLSVSMSRTGLAAVPSTVGDYVRLYKIIDGSAAQISQVPAGTFVVKTVFSRDSRFLFCSDSLGGSTIRSFAIAPNGAGTLAASAFTSAGSVQSLAVHPSLPILYASTALGQTIERYQIGDDGSLAFMDSTNTGGDSAVEFAIHPSGTYLYAGHVRNDVVTVLPMDALGALSAPIQTVTIGSDFRDVVTDGEFVFVTDESSIGGSPTGVIRFEIQDDGLLAPLNPFAPTGGTRPSMMCLWDPAKRIKPGDVDADGFVDLTDFLLLASGYEAIYPSPAYIPAADFDGDGDVDLDDFLVLAANYEG